jgi:hypothetical protein
MSKPAVQLKQYVEDGRSALKVKRKRRSRHAFVTKGCNWIGQLN